MKLGCIYNITSQGVAEAFSTNKDNSWGQAVTDVRSTIMEFNGFDGSGNFMLQVKFLGKLGYLLGVLRARPEGSGRPGDNSVTWIFVPSEMKISGSQLVSVIDVVKEEMAAPLGTNTAKLEELFSKEYPAKGTAITAVSLIKSKENGMTGYLTYGKGTDYTLPELLGDAIAQQVYGNYKNVCIFDNTLGLTSTTATPIKLSLQSFTTIEPPTDPNGFTPYLVGKEVMPFNTAIEVPVNSSVKVRWMKAGFADVDKILIVGANGSINNFKEAMVQDLDRKVRIKREWFDIRDSHAKPVKNCEICINNQNFLGDEMRVSEASLKSGMQVTVRHSQYQPYSHTFNQVSTSYLIQLEEKTFSQTYTLPKEEGLHLLDDAEVTIKSSKQTREIPLKGYYVKNGMLFYDFGLKNKMIYFFMGLGTAVIAFMIYLGVNYLLDDSASQDKEKTEYSSDTDRENVDRSTRGDSQTEEKQEEKKSETARIADEMINGDAKESAKEVQPEWAEYLDKNQIWHKKQLVKYDELKSLFQAMNTFDYSSIISQEEALKASAKYRELVDVIKQKLNQAGNKDLRDILAKKSPNKHTYNNLNDNGIDINNYIKYIKDCDLNSASRVERNAGNGTNKKPSTNNEKKKPQHTTDKNEGGLGNVMLQ